METAVYGYGYDPRCERYDTAIRALVKLYRSARWPLLAEVGITRRKHEDRLDEALLEIETIKTEDGIMQLIVACPFLVPAAQELLRRYAEAMWLSRCYHYAKVTRKKARRSR